MIGVVRRAARGIREHLYLFFVATGVVAAALVLLGTFALVVVNLQGLVAGWQQDVHVSAYFQPSLGVEDWAEAKSAIAGRVEVDAVSLVSPEEAAAWMTERMPEVSEVVGELGPSALPASLEITLRAEHRGAEAVDAFAESLSASGRFAEVDYGREWVGRAGSFLELLGMLGVALGVIIAVAALFLVGNTINLVVLARRDELEILRLVGATDGYILGPFVVEGVAQGLLGALAALGCLQAVHRGLLVQLDDILPLAFGAESLHFLPAGLVLALGLGGVLIGALPAWVAGRRFLARLP
ncbi:MAG: hypothetical protein FJ090_10145 [Deltaproteobacteria bacterium]|nr:hypothetical protein [Deltaproteobacteria bacterium]